MDICVFSIKFLITKRPFLGVIGAMLVVFSSCNQFASSKDLNNKLIEEQNQKTTIDLTKIPKDTIVASDKNFSIRNGICYYQGKLFSGILKKYYPRVDMTTYTSLYKGKRYGSYNSFYKNGQLYESKQYKNNRIVGRHLMYRPNGNIKADYHYKNGKMEGIQKKWYANGNPFIEFNYVNGKREGSQKAWRISGKLHINSQIINGQTFGLNKASLCYRVVDENIANEGYLKITEKPANKTAP